MGSQLPEDALAVKQLLNSSKDSLVSFPAKLWHLVVACLFKDGLVSPHSLPYLLALLLLNAQGISEYEDRVVQQLTNFLYGYTAEVLQDAAAIAETAGAPVGELTSRDVDLAIQSRTQFAFVPPPSQQVGHRALPLL
jgi:hypothetical protein